MAKTADPHDVYDIDKRTCALILGSNRLDDYASAFLEQHCQEALLTPMPLPVEKLLSDTKLSIEHRSLSPDLDVFGCCVLLDGEVQIYDRTSKRYKTEFFKAGTLLIDGDSEWAYSEGNKRNTLVHELLHWYKDKKYFEVLKMRAGEGIDISPIMCRQSQFVFTPGKRTQRNQVEWPEWQAHRLTPRILMPKEMFRKKALEYIGRGIKSCDEVVQELSDFFLVSRISAKIRLLEVGLRSEIEQLEDFSDVYTEIESRQELVALTKADALDLLLNNVVLQDWIESYGLVYVDGYFILPLSKYLSIKNGEIHLTNYAKKHLYECALNICEQKLHKYKHQPEELQCFAVLYKLGGGDERILVFLPGAQTEIRKTINKNYESATDAELRAAYSKALDIAAPDNEETEKALLRLLGDEDKSLCDCLWFLIEKAGWKTGLDFYDNTHIHENYYGRIKNNKANAMESDTLFAICVGLKLQMWIIEKIYNKSECKLHPYDEPDKTRIRIVRAFPALSIEDFNLMLTRRGLKELGTESKGNTQKG